MTMSTRSLTGVLCGLVLSAGCADKYAMVTAALMTDPETTGVDTETGTGSESGSTAETPTGTTPTSGDPSGDPSSDPSSDPSGDPSSDPDPTADTTGAPVTCDTPESCTAEGEGDISPLALPFFRGMVCVSDNVKPGEKIAMSFSTCAHPCLDVGGFKYKWTTRNTADGFEVAVVFYHPGTSGSSCPPDVFGEFPAEACVFAGPTQVTIGPLNVGDNPAEGDATLVVPFFTNAEAAAYDAGMDDGATVWANVAMHMQASDRLFPITLDAGNTSAPEACGEGVGGCTCRAVGL